MKKAVIVFALIVACLSSTGCSNSNIDKQKLCNGVWAARYGGTALWGTVEFSDYYIYDFSSNGTVIYYNYGGSYHDKGTAPSFSETKFTGKYKMDMSNKQIIIAFDEDSNGISQDDQTIPYYINEYTHDMIFKPDSNGESMYRNYASIDDIHFY